MRGASSAPFSQVKIVFKRRCPAESIVCCSFITPSLNLLGSLLDRFERLKDFWIVFAPSGLVIVIVRSFALGLSSMPNTVTGELDGPPSQFSVTCVNDGAAVSPAGAEG